MPADGSLRLPRVNVEWGTLNLTSPTATGSTFEGINLEGLGPLVYDVKVSMEDQGQTPTASMKWNPAAPAYSVYEKCIGKFSEFSIMITYHYVTGKSITFEFFWAGQSEVYGKEMEITVKMVSLMDGLINANFFATVQADKEEKGKNFKDSVTELKKQFGIAGISKLESRGPFIRYTDQADKDVSNAIVKVSYNDGATFMDALQNLVKDNGNNAFFNNINASNVVIFGPYTHEGAGETPIVQLPERSSNSPDPRKRYGHLIGPGIIQSFTRTMEWQPPQKSQEINSILAKKKEDDANRARQQSARRGRNGTSASSNPPSAQQAAAQHAPAPSGVHGSKNTANIRSQNNNIGPIKQDLFNKERACKLAFTTLMCPSLVGIKPLDIVFIPSYDGSYLEDWVVSSVEYQQTQGGVDLSVQATRFYGSNLPMSEASSNKIKVDVEGFTASDTAKSRATLESWMYYAWSYYLGFTSQATQQPSSPSPTSQQQQQSPPPPPAAQAQGIIPISSVPRDQLTPTESVAFNELNATFPPLPLDKAFTMKQTDPANPNAYALQVNDQQYYNWGSIHNTDPNVKYVNLGGNLLVYGSTLQQAQNNYANNYLPNRDAFLGGVVRSAYTRSSTR